MTNIPPPPPPPPPPGGFVPGSGPELPHGRGAQGMYRYRPRTVLLFALAIGGLFCGPLSIAGLVLATDEIAKIDSGQVDPATRASAKQARIISIVALILWAALLLRALF